MTVASTSDNIQSKQQFQIPVGELEIGMYISRLDRPWEETPFLFQGFILDNFKDLQLIQDLCQHVYIDVLEEIQRQGGGEGEEVKRKRTYVNKISADKELAAANIALVDVQKDTHLMLQSLKLGNAINVEKTKSVVANCVESILRNDSAMVFLAQMKQCDEEMAQHSLQVCILAISFARHLGMAEFELENMGICSLLHDVGKVKVPEKILKKRGKRTQAEEAIYRKHPEFGKQLLMSKSSIYPGVVDIAYCHHERVDGKGFPRGIGAENIPYFAKIIAIVDAYVNYTTENRNGLPLSSAEALRLIFESRNKHFDSTLVKQFIQLVGICPPGNIVEMSNGEVGVILSSDSRYKLRPKVLLLLDQYKQPGTKTVVDLAKGAVDYFGRPYMVKRVHPNGVYDLDVNDLDLSEFGK